jgi:hypothetical protein
MYLEQTEKVKEDKNQRTALKIAKFKIKVTGTQDNKFFKQK